MSWMCSTKGSSEGSCNARVVISGLNRCEVWWTWVFHTWGLDFSLSRLSFNINRKILCIIFFLSLMFLSFVIFLLNNLCLGKCNCIALWLACKKRQLLPTGKWVCWSHAKWLALLLYSFLLSMYLTEITGRWQGLIRIFCSVYMSLQTDSLPSASFDHATALGEKKRSGWALKALSSSWELCLSLACCCTSQS